MRLAARTHSVLALAALVALGTLPASPSYDTSEITGRVVDFASGKPIAGVRVTIGAFPRPSCSGWSECGSPRPPARVVRTRADGSFRIAVAGGTYYLVVSVDAHPTAAQTYAVLHRTVDVYDGDVALGNVRILRLSHAERAWLADLNQRRATTSYPATGPVVVDEYAEEQARRWSADIVARRTLYSDKEYASYQQAYASSPGSIGGASGALALVNLAQWARAERMWFDEKSNCPDGNWRTCGFANDTGHYINLSQESVVWVGLGESPTSFDDPPYGNVWAYDVMTIEPGNALVSSY